MPGNVLLWENALRKGHQPGLYPYASLEIANGEYRATLDFKVWAKMAMAINCYFTIAGTESRVQLTVYCKTRLGIYKLDDCPTDFTKCPAGRYYNITIDTNGRGLPVLKRAILAS
jgi:hypothetical protein